MSISRKLFAFDESVQKRIEVRLHENFPNSVELQVFFHFLEWMECQSWEKMMDGSNAQHYVAAKSLMNSITTMLQEKEAKSEDKNGKETFQYLKDSLQNHYGQNPTGLSNYLCEINSFLKSLVDHEATTDVSVSNDDVTIEVLCPIFIQELEGLDSLSKQNALLIKEIEQLVKEREKIALAQDNLQIEKLKVTQETGFCNPQEKSAKISELNRRIKHCNNGIVHAQLNKSIISSLKSLFENISLLISTKNKDLQSRILSEITEWNYNKQQAQVGWPAYSFSDFLQPLIPVCEKFAEILWATYGQSQKLVGFLTQIETNDETRIQVERLQIVSKSMISTFLKNCFVVEKQPLQIIATDKTFSASLRLLIGSKMLSTSQPPIITCSLHLDDEIKSFYDRKFENIKAQDENIQNVKNNRKAFTYDQETDSFNVCFDKLILNKPEKRKTKLGEDKTNKLVTDQKSCLMFQSEISIESEKFKIEAFSLPIVVIRNTNQYVESEATIFWDNAFGEKDRKPFISPERVSLPVFLEALNHRWSKSNELELKGHHLVYLAQKLFPGINTGELNQCHVTKRMFHKDNMIQWEFTFWSWFSKSMNLVKEFMLDEWRDGKIYGFIDKQEAEQKLHQYPVGTFLLRFSDSVPGGIAVAFKEDVLNCNHAYLGTKEDLKRRTLSDGLNDLSYLTHLYPLITPKDEAFKCNSTDENENKVNPRYPKKAHIRVVRYDDERSASTCTCSSNKSSSIQTPLTPLEACGDDSCPALSPSPFPLTDEDPLLSQANSSFYIQESCKQIDDMDKGLFFLDSY